MTDLRKMVLDGETYLLVPVDDTAHAIATAFCEMDDHEQADFFDHVHSISAHWPNRETQWCSMVDRMSIDAEEVLKEMAKFVDASDD